MRGALSTLYRGSIATLVGDAAIDIPPSATERECLDRVESAATPAQVRFLERLLGAWRHEAWAHVGQAPETLAPADRGVVRRVRPDGSRTEGRRR